MPRGSCRPVQQGADSCDPRWFIWRLHTFACLPRLQKLLDSSACICGLYASNCAKADLKVRVEVPIPLVEFGPSLFTSPSCSSLLFIPFDPIQFKCIFRADLKNFSHRFTQTGSVSQEGWQQQNSPLYDLVLPFSCG